MKKAIIISDKKPGHVNQCIAISKILNYEYEINESYFKSSLHQLLSYILDFLNIYTDRLFVKKKFNNGYNIIISAGSKTYYINKYYAKKLNIPNIAIQLPRGYRLNFTKVICSNYDNSPIKKNITKIDTNISYSDPKWYKNETEKFLENQLFHHPSIGIIIGGNSNKSHMCLEDMENSINKIFKLTPNHHHYVTTSRRTPKEIDNLLNKYKFEYKLIYRENNNYNPVPAFTQVCEHLFITSDSTSMISEAVCIGSSSVTIIPLKQKGMFKKFNKFNKFIEYLIKNTSVSLLKTELEVSNKKIDTESKIKEILKDIN